MSLSGYATHRWQIRGTEQPQQAGSTGVPRAGVAIGSVYQFLPDKRAIVQALTLRNMEAYLGRLTRRFTDDEFTHWWDGVDAAIDEYIAMHRTVPGFRTLRFGDVVDVQSGSIPAGRR